ncbi:MAG: copper chaperone PCu(A)C [Lysobacterales bacterium]
MRLRRLLSLRFLLLLPLIALAAPASLRVAHARITDAPPSATMRVGYLELHNDGDTAIRLSSADSDDFARVEMHQTVFDHGVAQMRALPEAVVPAHGQFAFAPGGAHLMLIGPKRSLAAGDRVRLTLVLDSGERLLVELGVLERDGAF